jgi:MFS transporter, ACS family, tartrate transporter
MAERPTLDLQTGFVTAIPYVVGALSMVLWPLLSDRMQEGKWNTALAFLVTAGGALAASTWFPDPVHKILMLCICAIGLFAIAPLFWTLPTAFLSGTAAAGGIALINSIGHLAGFATPCMMGYFEGCDRRAASSLGLAVPVLHPDSGARP